MVFLTPLQIALILIAIATYILYTKWLQSQYPPGPFPLPIISNLHQLSKKPFIELTGMAKIYGPILTIWSNRLPIVVVSDLQLMKEALVRKGSDFAGRGLDLLGFGMLTHDCEDLTTRSYDDKVRTLRKLTVSTMRAEAIKGFNIQKVVEDEMQRLVDILRDTHGKLVDPSFFFLLPVYNTLMRAVLKFRFKNEQDENFGLWRKATIANKKATERAILVSLAPALAYIIPGNQAMMLSHVQPLDDLVEKYVKYHEQTYNEGVIRDLTDVIIQHRRSQGIETPISHEITKLTTCGLVKNMLLGGTQTTLATLLWAFLILLHRKDIQRKIHLELDQYLGDRKRDTPRDRGREDQHKDQHSSQLLFTLPDKPNLPYLNAFIHEILRLWPVSPLGLPHKTMAKTSISSYVIPKDTVVLFNIYACHKDGAIWEKPLDFIPERFLDGNGLFDITKAKQLLTFGAGPRSCVGEKLAKMEIFSCLANVLHTFELCCGSVDELPVLTDGDYRIGFAPYHYKVGFKMRLAP